MHARIPVLFVALLAAFSLTGCLGGGRAGNDGPTTVTQDAPKIDIHVPPNQVVDQEKVVAELGRVRSDISTEVQNSSNNTQNALSGLVNASVSKVAERVTGVEASIKDLLTINNTATANVDTKFDSVLKATTTLDSRMEAVANVSSNISADLKANLSVMNEMKVELGKLNLGAQAGINNKMEQLQQDIKNTAGRDVNYLPREAVFMFVAIISALCALATTITLVMGRNARQRDKQAVDQERENVRYWQQVAIQAIAALDPSKADAVTRLIPPQRPEGNA